MSGHKIRTFLAYAQAALLIIIISSGMLFMHKHKTSEGRIIVHFHPYNLKTDPDATKHRHSDNEIHLLDVVFSGAYLQTDLFVFKAAPQQILEKFLIVSKTIAENIDERDQLFLRGPPALI